MQSSQLMRAADAEEIHLPRTRVGPGDSVRLLATVGSTPSRWTFDEADLFLARELLITTVGGVPIFKIVRLEIRGTSRVSYVSKEPKSRFVIETILQRGDLVILDAENVTGVWGLLEARLIGNRKLSHRRQDA